MRPGKYSVLFKSCYNHLIESFFQPFRFVERPAIRGFISYLNPKMQDNDIPKKSCMADSVNEKVLHLETVTFDIIEVYPYLFFLQISFTDNSI